MTMDGDRQCEEGRETLNVKQLSFVIAVDAHFEFADTTMMVDEWDICYVRARAGVTPSDSMFCASSVSTLRTTCVDMMRG